MKWFGKIVVLLLLTLVGHTGFATGVRLVVAPDGSGNFRTIQEAINSLPNTATEQRVIAIKKGTYKEKLFIDGKSHITLQGASEKGVIITFAQARDAWRCDPVAGADDWGVGTLNMRNSPDIMLENLTVVNSYGFDAPGDVTIDCATDPSHKRTISKTGHQMALRTLPGTTRLIVRHCTFRAWGAIPSAPGTWTQASIISRTAPWKAASIFTARAGGLTLKIAASFATARRPPSGTMAPITKTPKPF
ncbi:pectinesterase family protein [Hymenobacter jejuensis]|uniref:pectinesterase family protein n=1 Tax=Hymenobacter jejuensis TaxID=2502781 RepID=UPI001E41AE4F|nr:pectinesterase family protein [Hymenobacter jejuensis]